MAVRAPDHAMVRGGRHIQRERGIERARARERETHTNTMWCVDGVMVICALWNGGEARAGKEGEKDQRAEQGSRLKAQGSGISPVDKVNRDVAGLAVQPELLGDLDHLASPPTATVSGPSSSGAWPCSADHRGPSPPAPRGRPAGKHGRGARSGGGIGRDRQRSLQRGRQRIARREG